MRHNPNHIKLMFAIYYMSLTLAISEKNIEKLTLRFRALNIQFSSFLQNKEPHAPDQGHLTFVVRWKGVDIAES